MVLEQVSFDIETIGVAVDDSVTVIGVALPMACRGFVQASDCRPPAVEETAPADPLVHVQVSTYTSVEALFEAVGEFVADRSGSKFEFTVKSLTSTRVM